MKPRARKPCPLPLALLVLLEHLMQIGPLKLKAQLLSGEKLAMGPGRAGLLKEIQRTGSISAAGRKGRARVTAAGQEALARFRAL